MLARQTAEDVLARYKPPTRHRVTKVGTVTQESCFVVVNPVAERVTVDTDDAEVGIDRIEPVDVGQVDRATRRVAFDDIGRIGNGGQHLFGGFGHLLLVAGHQGRSRLKVAGGSLDGGVGIQHRRDQ